jgi:hypothetical protein
MNAKIMIRKEFITESASINISIPKEYVGKELELIIFPKEEVAENGCAEEIVERAEYACKLSFRDYLQPSRSCAGLTILNPYI